MGKTWQHLIFFRKFRALKKTKKLIYIAYVIELDLQKSNTSEGFRKEVFGTVTIFLTQSCM